MRSGPAGVEVDAQNERRLAVAVLAVDLLRLVGGRGDGEDIDRVPELLELGLVQRELTRIELLDVVGAIEREAPERGPPPASQSFLASAISFVRSSRKPGKVTSSDSGIIKVGVFGGTGPLRRSGLHDLLDDRARSIIRNSAWRRLGCSKAALPVHNDRARSRGVGDGAGDLAAEAADDVLDGRPGCRPNQSASAQKRLAAHHC